MNQEFEDIKRKEEKALDDFFNSLGDRIFKAQDIFEEKQKKLISVYKELGKVVDSIDKIYKKNCYDVEESYLYFNISVVISDLDFKNLSILSDKLCIIKEQYDHLIEFFNKFLYLDGCLLHAKFVRFYIITCCKDNKNAVLFNFYNKLGRVRYGLSEADNKVLKLCKNYKVIRRYNRFKNANFKIEFLKSSNNRDGFVTLNNVFEHCLNSFGEVQCDTAFLAVLQNIFAGRMSFYIKNKQEILLKYSFKDCYNKFVKSMKDKSDIYFDAISPQLFPCKNVKSIDRDEGKYGIFYNYSSNPEKLLDMDQWVFHFSSEDSEACTLSSLKNVPPVLSLACSEDGKLAGEILSEVDFITSMNSNKYKEESYFSRGSVFVEKFVTHPAFLSGVPRKSGIRVDSAKVMPKFSELNFVERKVNEYKLAFVEFSGKVFMFSDSNVHPYDKRFSTYFDKLNSIVDENEMCYGNYSYLFFIFLMANGIEIKFKDEDGLYPISSKESLKSCSGGKEFFTLNSVVYEKMKCDLSFCMTNNKNLYTSNACFRFLSELYITEADFTKTILDKSFEDICSKFYENNKLFYEKMFENKSNKAKQDKKFIPDCLTVEDVFKLLIESNSEEDINKYRACLALFFNLNGKNKTEILKKYYTERLKDENLKKNNTNDNRSLSQMRADEVNDIQEEIYDFLEKLKNK